MISFCQGQTVMPRGSKGPISAPAACHHTVRSSSFLTCCRTLRIPLARATAGSRRLGRFTDLGSPAEASSTVGETLRGCGRTRRHGRSFDGATSMERKDLSPYMHVEVTEGGVSMILFCGVRIVQKREHETGARKRLLVFTPSATLCAVGRVGDLVSCALVIALSATL